MQTDEVEDLLRAFYGADLQWTARKEEYERARARAAKAFAARKAIADRLKGLLSAVEGTVSLPVGCNSHVVWDGHVLRVSSGMTAADVLRLQPKPETPPVADAVTDDDDCGEDAPTGFAATY